MNDNNWSERARKEAEATHIIQNREMLERQAADNQRRQAEKDAWQAELRRGQETRRQDELKRVAERQHQEQLKATNRNTLVTGIGAAVVAYTVAKSSKPNVVVINEALPGRGKRRMCDNSGNSCSPEDFERYTARYIAARNAFNAGLFDEAMLARCAAVGQDEEVWGVPELNDDVFSFRFLDKQDFWWGLFTNINTGDTCFFTSEAEIARRNSK